jgi:hypothetical protein
MKLDTSFELGHALGDVLAAGFEQSTTVDAMGNFDPRFEKFKESNLKIIRSVLQP